MTSPHRLGRSTGAASSLNLGTVGGSQAVLTGLVGPDVTVSDEFTIIQMTGSKSKLVYRPLPTDDPKVRQPDITRARTLLDWEPHVPLEEGLVKTLDYFKTKVT